MYYLFQNGETENTNTVENSRVSKDDIVTKTKMFAKSLGEKSVRCENIIDDKMCTQNMSARRLAHNRKYCRVCTTVCEDATCGKIFTPDHAGYGMSKFCSACTACPICGIFMYDPVCGNCSL